MIEQEIARARERPRSAGVRWKFKPALIIAAAVLAAIALALVFKNVLLGSAETESVSFSDASASSTASGASDSATSGADPSGTGTSGAAGSSSAGSGNGVDLKVYVTGAVLTPGVYPLGSDSRIEDAIAAAGGFTESADPLKVNLASRVSDGQQIYVPTVGEQVPPELAAGSGSGSGGSGGGSGTGTGGSGAGSGGNVAPVNINTATSEQLQELPGIGPALAERILQWRSTNGNFRSVEELDNVSGIGPALMGRLRDQVQI